MAYNTVKIKKYLMDSKNIIINDFSLEYDLSKCNTNSPIDNANPLSGLSKMKIEAPTEEIKTVVLNLFERIIKNMSPIKKGIYRIPDWLG